MSKSLMLVPGLAIWMRADMDSYFLSISEHGPHGVQLGHRQLWNAVFCILGVCWEAAPLLDSSCAVLRWLIFLSQFLCSLLGLGFLWWHHQELFPSLLKWHRSQMASMEQRLGFEFYLWFPFYFLRHFPDWNDGSYQGSMSMRKSKALGRHGPKICFHC